jgi:hypothetical protein
MAKKRSRTRKVSKKSIIVKKEELSKKRSRKRTSKRSKKTQEGGSMLPLVGAGAVVILGLIALLGINGIREQKKSKVENS